MRDPRLRPFRVPLAAFGLFVALQAVSGAVLFVGKLGLRPGHLAAYYRGDEVAMRAPRTLGGLLEVAVPHLVAIPLVLFVTLHLVGFVGLIRRRPFAVLAAASFACALAGVITAFGIRWLWPWVAWIKLVAFLGLELSLLTWLSLLAWLFVPPRSPLGAAGAPGGPPGPWSPGGELKGWAARAGASWRARARPARGSAR